MKKIYEAPLVRVTYFKNADSIANLQISGVSVTSKKGIYNANSKTSWSQLE